MHFERPQRHESTEPQLATMIDVFAVLIIFLIAGTTMDSSILQIPVTIVLPSTTAVASTINAPQITVLKDKIWFSLTDKEYPLDLLKNPDAHAAMVQQIQDEITHYQAKSNEKKTKVQIGSASANYINVVAAKDTPYRDIFLAIKFFRNAGFKSAVLVGTSQFVGKSSQ